MDIENIKELLNFLEQSSFHKFRIKEENGFEIEVDKTPPSMPMTMDYSMQLLKTGVSSGHPPMLSVDAPLSPMHKEGIHITSPMVGTFYDTPSPEQPPFVRVGDRVEEDTVVCIIEAMKVMNEVKAGKSGIIVEVLVDNSHPVEFGTKLFRIQ